MKNLIMVKFDSGISRNGDYPVNYMYVIDGEVEIYAEIDVRGISIDEIDEYGYEYLKEEIVKKAVINHIDFTRLSFWYRKPKRQGIPYRS